MSCSPGTSSLRTSELADGSGRADWLHLGAFDATCAESLATAGMTIGAAAYLAPVCDPASVPERTNIPPGSQDPRVPALQVALIALGFPIALDGISAPGPRRRCATSSALSASRPTASPGRSRRARLVCDEITDRALLLACGPFGGGGPGRCVPPPPSTDGPPSPAPGATDGPPLLQGATYTRRNPTGRGWWSAIWIAAWTADSMRLLRPLVPRRTPRHANVS